MLMLVNQAADLKLAARKNSKFSLVIPPAFIVQFPDNLTPSMRGGAEHNDMLVP